MEGEDDNSMSSVVENVSDLELVRAGWLGLTSLDFYLKMNLFMRVFGRN